MTSRFALIPVVCGSKRLPRNNILPLAGKLMLSWTIHTALKSNLFDHVCVSTVDEEIATVVTNSGVDVFGPLSLQVIRLLFFKFPYIICLQWQKIRLHLNTCLCPTVQLRTAHDLQQIFRTFELNSNAQAVIAVTEYSYYPFQAFQCSDSGELIPFLPNLVRKLSSDLPQLFAGNGSTNAVKVDPFLKYKDFYIPDGMYPYVTSQISSIDVDTFEDYQLLKACHAIMSSSVLA